MSVSNMRTNRARSAIPNQRRLVYSELENPQRLKTVSSRICMRVNLTRNYTCTCLCWDPTIGFHAPAPRGGGAVQFVDKICSFALSSENNINNNNENTSAAPLRPPGLESVPEPRAGLFPLALRAPLLAVLHAIHLAAFLVLAADASRRHGHLGAVRPRRQLQQLVGRLGDVDGAGQQVLAVRADDLALVLGILVRGPGHVAMRHSRRRAAVVQAHLDFGVVELFLTVWYSVPTIPKTKDIC